MIQAPRGRRVYKESEGPKESKDSRAIAAHKVLKARRGKRAIQGGHKDL